MARQRTRTPTLAPVPSAQDIAAAIDWPVEGWAHQCHAVSIAIVKARIFPTARVARGSCPGVGGQHSWVVLGADCYDPQVQVVDATLWSYVPDVETVWTGRAGARPHTPHGAGNIFEWGKPETGGGAPVELAVPVSTYAEHFLDLLGPLDLRGWMNLASHAPVGGWPAGEILAAMADTPELAALVPIDRLGMLTDRNPSGLYLP